MTKPILTMTPIPWPPCRIAMLQKQKLDRAREIIRGGRPKGHTSDDIQIAASAIARLSPHQYEADCARDALASITAGRWKLRHSVATLATCALAAVIGHTALRTALEVTDMLTRFGGV